MPEPASMLHRRPRKTGSDSHLDDTASELVVTDSQAAVEGVGITDEGHGTKQTRSPPAQPKTLGETVVAIALITPTLLHWVVSATAYFVGNVQLLDSNGVAHTIARTRSNNFVFIFFATSTTCISTVGAHIWLTLGAIMRRHKLDQAGEVHGEAYYARLDRAEEEARKLSTAEWVHIAVVACDFFFAAFLIFRGRISIPGGEFSAGILPGGILAIIMRFIVPPARAAVVRNQRTNSIAFAGSALRGSVAVLMVQVLVLARFIAFAVNYPVDLFRDDCAFEENIRGDSWRRAALISTCTAALFAIGVVPDSKAMVYQHHFPLRYQFWGSLVPIYYLVTGCALYYAARGQGLLHDKLFTELDMTKTHVVALLLWMLATFGVVLALAVMWAEWSDPVTLNPFRLTVHVCATVGLIGMLGVLWMNSILAALGRGEANRIAKKKVIVMSCPEWGTKDEGGKGPYDQNVMVKVAHLADKSKGRITMGFDRAGSSNAIRSDASLFERARELQEAGEDAAAKEVLRSTGWFLTYQGRAKGTIFSASQNFGGIIVVLCIKGGPVTRLEAEEMGRIVEEAEADNRMSGINCRIEVTELSYYEFLRDYDDTALSSDRM